MRCNLRKALAFLLILGMGISLIDVVLAQGRHVQIYVSPSYGTWPDDYPFYFYYPEYPYWAQYNPYYTYNPFYNPYYENDVEMRHGEAAAQWLFYQGIGEPWIGGNPPHSWWDM
jgi:hypothetical protein